jgi:ubiquinone/menaquinone biosynthesis C-methylase UbiE
VAVASDNHGVSEALKFDPGLYRGTAGYYDRFRVPYPQAMLDELLGFVQPSGHGRLLDLACGTGQISFAIAEQFAEVWAVDQEPDMIRVVREKARVSGPSHVRAIVSPAQELDAPSGGFELVAIGNAFHRLRRETVAADLFRWLQPNGCVALLWGTGPWITPAAPWEQAIVSVLSQWQSKLEVESRVPAGWEDVRRKRPDAEVLRGAGFEVIRSSRFPTVHEWSVEALIGLVYSTSFLPRAVLGDRVEMFEGDLHRALDRFEARNELNETIDFGYELACRPG